MTILATLRHGLTAHERIVGIRDGLTHCQCGWRSTKLGTENGRQQHREHVAGKLAQALTSRPGVGK